jgi:hypothetical protein
MLKNGARTGVSLRKWIAFDVPDPVNPANLSAEARNVLAGTLARQHRKTACFSAHSRHIGRAREFLAANR